MKTILLVILVLLILFLLSCTKEVTKAPNIPVNHRIIPIPKLPTNPGGDPDK